MNERANRLSELRKKRGISQTVVGDFLSLSQSRVSDYEKGENIPSDILKGFAEYYSVSTDYILCLTDDKNGVPIKNISDDEYLLLLFYRNLTPDVKVIFDGIIGGICSSLGKKL